MREILLCLIITLCGSLAFSQTGRHAEISGQVFDEGSNPLSAATVMLLTAKDSVLTSFTSTNADGSFVLKNVDPGDYLIRVSYVGYATYTAPVRVDEQNVALENLILTQAAAQLSEVEIQAEHVPIQMHKDTISYQAEAFQTQPNAVVEDLLKKLPGVEVDADGNIKAQGEDVRNVLVDGKEFFGTDPKVATKNLPAKAIKKVQVYDKLSEMAEFSGIDDGQREKTINLELREEFKTGLFGTAEAGYGSDARYMSKANINKFTKTSQLSFLGLLNNVNEQGFSVEEYLNFSGGMRGMSRGGGGRIQLRTGADADVPLSRGIGTGFTQTFAGGINYNFEIGKKLDVRSSYFYNNVGNDLLQRTFRQGFLNGSTYETDEDSERSSENQSHRIHLRAEYEIDSTQNIELVTTTAFGEGEASSHEMQQTLNDLMVPENSGITDDIRQSDRINFSGDLYYRKRFGKKGRVASAQLTLNNRDEDAFTDLMALNTYFTTGNTEVLDQLQTSIAENLVWGGQVAYTEPITKKQFLEFGYVYRDISETSERNVADIDTLGNEVPNAMLSIRFHRDLIVHRPGLTWRLNVPQSSLSIGLEYEDVNLEGRINAGEFPVTRHLQSILPSLRWRYDIATARNLRADYRTSTNVPSISQLAPVVDNSNPLNIYVGNPSLRGEYVHQASIHYHAFSQFSFTSIFAMLRGTLTKNKIVNETVIDEQFVETTRPVNIDNDYQLAVYASFGTPLRFVKSRIHLNTNIQYNKSLLPINGVLNDLDRWTRTFGVRFQNQNSDVLEYSFGGNWTQSTTQYSESDARDQDFFTHHYFADITVRFLRHWSLNTAFDYRLYTGDVFEQNQELPIWRASLSRYIMDRRGQFRLSVFDLLDENKGLNRSSTANYIEEIRANSIGRYAMLSFLYSIQGFDSSASGTGGPRVFRH